jgi:cytochrome c oxidase cbb3-type subunit 3
MPRAARVWVTTTLSAAAVAVSLAAAQGPANGRGALPPPAGQGRGGRGPNFPQFQRPPADPAVVARGKALFTVNCQACHGADLRGGDQGGPNLLRSEIVLKDDHGELIAQVVQTGRQTPGMAAMPALPLAVDDIHAVAEYIHSVAATGGNQGRPPGSGDMAALDVVVGDATAGQAYFKATCSACHSATGDLAGIGSRVPDARALQNLWVSGSAGGGGRRGRGAGAAGGTPTTVTVTMANGQAIEGRLVRIDDFIVTLVGDDGVRRTMRRAGAVPRVEVHNPLEPHRKLVPTYREKDMHDVTAYLVTLK